MAHEHDQVGRLLGQGRLHQEMLVAVADDGHRLLGEVEHRFRVHLGIAAGDHHARAGMLVEHAADQLSRLLAGLGRDRAGVDHIDIRLGLKGHQLRSLRLKAVAKAADSNWLTLQPKVVMAIRFMGTPPRCSLAPITALPTTRSSS